MESNKITEIRRLLGYMSQYRLGFIAGAILLALLGLSEGLVALMFVPAMNVVLNPASTNQKLALVTLPHGRTIYLNSFFPPSIHHVWTVFSISLIVLFAFKALAEFMGTSLSSTSAIPR